MADQWLKGKPAGGDNASDIDTLVQANNASLDRLLFNLNHNNRVVPASASTVTALAGEMSIPNSDGSVVRLRRNTSSTTVSVVTDLDTGAEAVSTRYYVYATADVDETTFRYTVSTNSSAPSGVTYYRLAGGFYNDASGDITDVWSYGPGTNAMYMVSDTDVSDSTGSYVDDTPAIMRFYSSGRPTLFMYNVGAGSSPTEYPFIQISIDGTDKAGTIRNVAGFGSTQLISGTTFHVETMSAGTHTFQGRFKGGSGGSTAYINYRFVLIVEL